MCRRRRLNVNPLRFPATAYNPGMSDIGPPSDRVRIIRWVVAGIVVWGVVHAIGAWRLNQNPLRPVVVLACVGAFLGFWMTMLAARQRRLSRRR